jgi:hypothetical protein
VRDAVLEALRTRGNAGSMSSGLHHARYDYGKGYCTINGLAIGAKLALQEGAKRILIVDLDAHGGGGTASLIAGVPGIEQIDVSVSSYDHYVGTPQCNYTLVSTASDYLPVVQAALAQCNEPESIDLIIYKDASIEINAVDGTSLPFSQGRLQNSKAIARNIEDHYQAVRLANAVAELFGLKSAPKKSSGKPLTAAEKKAAMEIARKTALPGLGTEPKKKK